MRSYQKHVEDISSQKPGSYIFRSSSLFPIMITAQVKARVVFLGYWQVKRRILKLGCVCTLRSQEGEIIHRDYMPIETAKAYCIEVEPLLKGWSRSNGEFIGSLEVEFFSDTNLVFPFPAVTVNYHGEDFCSFVHTAQRVYNNHEDKEKNSQHNVPESGFSLRCTGKEEPFFAFVNGPEKVEECTAGLTIINSEQASLSQELVIGPLKPYESRFVYPAREYPIKEFLKADPGTIKVSLQLPWVFPRLLCGNIGSDPIGFSLTHSYYDQSDIQGSSAYWIPRSEEKYVEALSLPVRLDDPYNTYLTFYPIYSPSEFTVSVEGYTANGKCVEKVENVYVQNRQGSLFQRVCCKTLFKKKDITSIRVCLIEKGRVPSRIKVALDIEKQDVPLCSNICTNLQPYIPAFEEKPHTFRWLPIFADRPGAACYVINGSLDKNPAVKAKLHCIFYREQDNKTKKKTITLPPQATYALLIEQDPSLQEFFNGKPGWVTISSTNPYTTTYSFSFHPSGIIGGDHGF